MKCCFHQFQWIEQLVEAIKILTTLRTLWLIKVAPKLLVLNYSAGVTNFIRHKNRKISDIRLSDSDLINLYRKLDPRPHLSDSIRISCGMKYYEDALKENEGRHPGLFSNKLRCINALIFEMKKSRLPDEALAYFDAYMKMVQMVGQRQVKACLLIKLNSYNPIIANVPKDITRLYDH